MRKRRALIIFGRLAWSLAAMYVAFLYGWIWGYTFRTGNITVGLVQAHVYAGVIVAIYLLTEKALWAKRKESS